MVTIGGSGSTRTQVAYAWGVRGLLIVNPRATTTSPRVTDVLVQAFTSDVELEVITTTHRGHGLELGEQAHRDGLDLVITLGGDGLVNEVINGLLADGPGPKVPMLATVPGGSGNVFARALGLPAHAVQATAQLLDAIRHQRSRTIGLGRANGRYFAANAGLGIDAEVIAAMERQRRAGHHASPLRYLATASSALLRAQQRVLPSLVLQRPGTPTETVTLAFVQNTSPWTYFGSLAIDPCPSASFDTGLDVFALRRMDAVSTAQAVSRMVLQRRAGSDRRSVVLWHDQAEFSLTSNQPVAMQIDGEGVGQVLRADFVSVPQALRVLC
jgi:diacylglycerol kinase family enzyme